MIEIWMKNHLVSDSKCKIVNPYIPQKIYKEWQIMLGTLYRNLQFAFSTTIRIGDTKYHI